MYNIVISDRASSYYEKLPSDLKRRINKAIDSLETNPIIGSNIKKLSGQLSGLYRYRIGHFRIIYQVNRTDGRVNIIDIAPRGNVYK